MGVGDKGRACKVGVQMCHDMAVPQAVLDLLVTSGPKLLLSL